MMKVALPFVILLILNAVYDGNTKQTPLSLMPAFLVSTFKNKSSIDNLRKFYEGKIVLVTGTICKKMNNILLYYIIIYYNY